MVTAHTFFNRAARALQRRGFALIFISFLSINASAAPGDLDNTFGAFGKATASFSSLNDKANAVALQPDGKIVVAGECSSGSGTSDFCVARYTASGTLDSMFNGDGKLVTVMGSGINNVSALALQSDGKIVAAGSCSFQICLARYTATGSLDTSFNGSGKVITTAGANDSDASSVVLGADGKIVVGGACDTTSTSSNSFCVLRFNADGTPDTSFSGDGKIVTTIGSLLASSVRNVLLQPDGKIVATGFCGVPNTSSDGFCVARYNTNGTLDTTFGGDGKIEIKLGDFSARIGGSVLQPDGKIVMAGDCDPATGATLPRFCVARVTASGSLDTTFNTDGQAFTTFSNAEARARGVALQTDGKIVLAGRCYDIGSGNVDFCLARYHGSGSIDSSFTVDGRVTTPIGNDQDDANALAIQPDGKIVVIGACGTGLNQDFCLARFEGGPYDARNCSLDIDGDGRTIATIDGLIATRVMLGMSGSAVISGITFAANAARDEWGTNTSRDIRKYLITQCGMNL